MDVLVLEGQLQSYTWIFNFAGGGAEGSVPQHPRCSRVTCAKYCFLFFFFSPKCCFLKSLRFFQDSYVIHNIVVHICYCLYLVLCSPHTLVALNYLLFGYVKRYHGSKSQREKGYSEMHVLLSSATPFPTFFLHSVPTHLLWVESCVPQKMLKF